MSNPMTMPKEIWIGTSWNSINDVSYIECNIVGDTGNLTHYTRTSTIQPLLEECERALDEADSAIWDSHYGKGIRGEYARKVTGDIQKTLARIKEFKDE